MELWTLQKSTWKLERVTLRNGSLTSSLCSYCEVGFFSTSLTQSYSHSDRVVSTLFKTSQGVHFLCNIGYIADVFISSIGTGSVGIENGIDLTPTS